MTTQDTLVLDESLVVHDHNLQQKEVFWVGWDGPDDPANPRNWTNRRKWLLSSSGIMFCAIVSLSVSGQFRIVGETSYSISIGSIEDQMGVSKGMALLGVTLFTLTFGAAPLIIAPFSEVYGRSWIYFGSAFIFTLFFLPQALAQNIETILVARFISGCAGSTAVSLVGGTLADVWSDEERGLPMAIFAWSAFSSSGGLIPVSNTLQTGLGPIMFGYVEENYDFRLIQWITMGASGLFTLALGCIVLPRETRASVLLSRKAARLRKETGDSKYQCKFDLERGSFTHMMTTALSRPVKMLATEPILISFSAYIAFCWAILYIQLVSLPLVFGELYGFSIGEAGMTYAAQFIGASVGLVVDHFCNKKYIKEVGRRGPEARLYSAMAGGIFVPVGCFSFTFTSFTSIPWIVPCICVSILYVGILLIYLAVFSYLADSYTLYASSALLVGAVFPLFTDSLYDRLGIQGAGGLTSGLATLLSVTPFVLFIYGARLRARSPFAQELERMKRAAQALAELKEEEVVLEPKGCGAPTNQGDVGRAVVRKLPSGEGRKEEA
ncbi:BZ3500_MvSof-1268-A1-R1_Chr1-3g01876 [Microbotryum saponariae]|uniref:BZ3500_MvSof-1268-A1-R1_Chr1-3g01876 protein n=1 Tax=Microbotryum saponariae TaxID=289078 RepID=A0A2X0KRI0_9BASI|nr:BZ3500_MvSof-1268-A1-R1_Chr1-3g01876 [Microbotryum saponariae]SCZ94798.1 BZ3501_MvSof-1269-A2-R1_Chr1-3g01478 [Microbotryum saponariae]